MAAKRLTQEELIEAFNQYMPKRPTYPRIALYDDEVLENSATESESSESEEDPSERVKVYLEIKDEMSAHCLKQYKNSRCKTPSKYIKDNIQSDLEKALEKLANLKVKPKNPIEWLGYCLLNMNINDPHPPTGDHKIKPTKTQLRCKIDVICHAEYVAVPVPVIVSNPMYQNYSPRASPATIKRRHHEMGPTME